MPKTYSPCPQCGKKTFYQVRGYTQGLDMKQCHRCGYIETKKKEAMDLRNAIQKRAAQHLASEPTSGWTRTGGCSNCGDTVQTNMDEAGNRYVRHEDDKSPASFSGTGVDWPQGCTRPYKSGAERRQESSDWINQYPPDYQGPPRKR